MELCTGGSLYNILDDPVNAYGVEEVEFFRVLHDVGMFKTGLYQFTPTIFETHVHKKC